MEELATRLDLYAARVAPARRDANETNVLDDSPARQAAANVLDDADALWAPDTMDDARRAAAEAVVATQGPDLSQFWREKYARDASRAWDKLYKRSATVPYKDRHYLDAVFPGAFAQPSGVVLEVGCGCGSAVVPLLEAHRGWRGVAVDFAPSAVALATRRVGDLELTVARCDVVNDALPVADGAVDVVLCLFVLSGIAPEFLTGVVEKLARALKPGGRLLLRDYGRFDEAQLRLKKGTRLGEHHYVKADGTCCFYFEVDDVAPLFARHFETVSLGLDCRQEANRATRQRRRRVFVRGQFRKR